MDELSCGTCKHFKEGTCDWWLLEVQPLDEYSACFIPSSEPKYPLMPRQHLNARTHKWPDAHGRCFYCGTKLTGRRRHYCSDNHVQTYYNRFSWIDTRAQIWKRDENRCVLCSIRLKFEEAEIDHIQAIALGGAYWDYANMRTLCIPCHKRKTKHDLQTIKVNKLKQTILANVKGIDSYFKRCGNKKEEQKVGRS